MDHVLNGLWFGGWLRPFSLCHYGEDIHFQMLLCSPLIAQWSGNKSRKNLPWLINWKLGNYLPLSLRILSAFWILGCSDEVSIIMWVWARLTDLREWLEPSRLILGDSCAMKQPPWGREGVAGVPPLVVTAGCSGWGRKGTDRSLPRPGSSRAGLSCRRGLPWGGAAEKGWEPLQRLGLRLLLGAPLCHCPLAGVDVQASRWEAGCQFYEQIEPCQARWCRWLELGVPSGSVLWNRGFFP